jgi:tyrosyl-tRNA synthetase
MTRFRSDLLRELESRGFLHQCTDLDALDALAAAGPVTGYVGFDCTADSLHVGNLVSIMLLRTLQRTGHRPIALVGGGTTKVGDPSGKDETRRLLTDEALDANKAGIRRSLGRFLDFREGGALLVDNDAWLSELRYIPFLRDFGAHFTINRMLTFDSVRLRLEREQPLTLLEFNYMVMQAYDFLELSRRHACRLQLGGSDQWGNIVNGVELGRRVDNTQLFGLTTPLITTAAGEKMGKTPATPSGSTTTSSRPSPTGSSGATPRTPTSAASCACSPNCLRTRSGGSRRSRAPRSTRRRRFWPSTPPACATAPRRPRPPRRPRAPFSRATAAASTTCPWSPATPPGSPPECRSSSSSRPPA